MLLAVTISWVVSVILTATNVLSTNPNDKEYYARTDVRLDVMETAEWFFMPYPGTVQFIRTSAYEFKENVFGGHLLGSNSTLYTYGDDIDSMFS